MTKIKICGITDVHDASMASQLGADALGFIFAPSPRQVSPEQARCIIHTLPPFVKTVGIFVDDDLGTIREIMDFCGLDMVQLHGNESPEFCRQLMPHSIKAFRLKDTLSLSPIRNYQGRVRALLLDTYERGIKGGTGKTFDWSLACEIADLGVPVILSGGLEPSNIQRAISTVRPYAVDVNSGVEIRPGQKSPILMKELIKAVRRMSTGGSDHD